MAVSFFVSEERALNKLDFVSVFLFWYTKLLFSLLCVFTRADMRLLIVSEKYFVLLIRRFLLI